AANRLNGLNGNDTIYGGNGNDIVIGDDGNDFLYGAGGENGSNVVNTDRLDGGTGRDFLYGSDGQDTLIGRDGDDFMVGNDGDDVINGGAGIDWASYRYASGAVSASLATGSSAGADGVDTLVQIERLQGSAFNDTLTGNAADNVLAGFDGDDTLDGRAGADRLQGDRGNDTLTGGADADRFVFGNNFGDDVITDFDTVNAERIDLSANSSLNSFADVLASLTNVGGFAQINDGANSILLDGIAFGDVSATGPVSASDFIF
ncbi:MAG: calcium-binding protein, partial [Ruegeria sp.]